MKLVDSAPNFRRKVAQLTVLSEPNVQRTCACGQSQESTQVQSNPIERSIWLQTFKWWKPEREFENMAHAQLIHHPSIWWPASVWVIAPFQSALSWRPIGRVGDELTKTLRSQVRIELVNCRAHSDRLCKLMPLKAILILLLLLLLLFLLLPLKLQLLLLIDITITSLQMCPLAKSN